MTEKYTFAVVTKAPMERGNLAVAMDLFLDPQIRGMGYSPDAEPEELHEAIGMPQLFMMVLAPVFRVGEVLILDESGREAGYPGRKPSKWQIVTERFDDLDAAVARGKVVFDAYLDELSKPA